MFEQSMILDHATGKRTGALAVSLTLQAAAVGVLLVIPLLYNESLPDVPRLTSLVFREPPPLLPPEPVHATAVPQTTRSSLQPRFVFHLDRPAPQATAPVIVNWTAPSFDAGPLAEGPPGNFTIAPLSRPIHVVPMPEPAVRVPDKPRPVGGDVQAAKILRRVTPVYPALAIQARISGTVRLIGVIAKDGTVQRLEVDSGNPLLVRAALDAVSKWVYKPTLLNGEPVEVIAPIDVIFTLSR
jgi:periplasmic protein TonB